MSLPRQEGISRSVVLVTDGYISGEQGVFDHIRANLNRCNVFAFGIGSSVNRYLIEGVAKAGMGEPFIVTEEAEAEGVADEVSRVHSDAGVDRHPGSCNRLRHLRREPDSISRICLPNVR